MNRNFAYYSILISVSAQKVISAPLEGVEPITASINRTNVSMGKVFYKFYQNKCFIKN